MKTWFRWTLMHIMLVACGLVPVLAAAGAEVLNRYFVLKVSQQDHAAVMRVNDGAAKLVRVGDAVGKRGRVAEIAEGRVVIEEGTGKDSETIIIRLEQGKQVVERMRKTAPKSQQLYGVAK